jgi:hypothetical protein
MTRKAYFWPVLVIGVILVIAPFAISLPSKASAGQAMLDNFHPIMQPANVKETVTYFGAFQDLRPVATGGIAAASEIPQLVAGLAKSLHMSPAQVEQFPSLRTWGPDSTTSSHWSQPCRTTSTTTPKSTVCRTFDCSHGSLRFRESY